MLVTRRHLSRETSRYILPLLHYRGLAITMTPSSSKPNPSHILFKNLDPLKSLCVRDSCRSLSFGLLESNEGRNGNLKKNKKNLNTQWRKVLSSCSSNKMTTHDPTKPVRGTGVDVNFVERVLLLP